MSTSLEAAGCQCGSCPPARPRATVQAGRTARTLPSLLLGLGIAFFPKCPFCWAAYMSALGSLGLVRIPYLPWMLPVLLGLLAVQLLVLARQLTRRRYWPFACGVLGAACMVLARRLDAPDAWLLYAGPALLVAGSLLNTFAPSRATSSLPQLTA